MSDIAKNIGKTIRRLRIERQYSQEQLASFAGMSPKYLSEVERGERNISVELLAALATQLQVSLSEMLDDAQPIEKEEVIGQIVRLLQPLPLEVLTFVRRSLSHFKC